MADEANAGGETVCRGSTGDAQEAAWGFE